MSNFRQNGRQRFQHDSSRRPQQWKLVIEPFLEIFETSYDAYYTIQRTIFNVH